MFIAARDELEEQVRGVLIKRNIAHFITLCRYRHSVTYADTAIMPIRAVAGSRFPGVMRESLETSR